MKHLMVPHRLVWNRREILVHHHAELLCIGSCSVADRDAHAHAIEEGKVVFSPLEVEQLAVAHQEGLSDKNFARTSIETKRAFPGARLEDVQAGDVRNREPKAQSLADAGEADAAQPD